jgi:hypothetical protein
LWAVKKKILWRYNLIEKILKDIINFPISTAKEILNNNRIEIDCIKHTRPLVDLGQTVEERVVRADINHQTGGVILITAFFPIINIDIHADQI